jgi:hypothetical protein
MHPIREAIMNKRGTPFKMLDRRLGSSLSTTYISVVVLAVPYWLELRI